MADSAQPVAAPTSAAEGGLSPWNFSLGKRLLDGAVSAVALSALSPLLLLIAIAVKLSSPGPVFFRQRRTGRGGAEFWILKFRTMVHGSAAGGPNLTRKGDSRVTRTGRMLRKWKLDELPQFFNVLLGHMSLVGPRPDVPEYSATLQGERRAVLSLKPGVTGWATIQFRDEESLLAQVPPDELVTFYANYVLPRKVDLDLAYARTATLLNDIKVVLRTIASI